VTLARALAGAAIVLFLLYYVGIEAVYDRVRALPAWYIAFGLIYYFVCQVISAFRWQVLLRVRGIETRFSRLRRLYLVGMFANNFLPGAVGGDAVKALGVYRDDNPGDLAAASVLVERFLGLAALGTLGLIAAVPVLADRQADPVVLLATVGTAAAIGLAGLIVWCPPISSRVARMLGSARLGRAGTLFRSLFVATEVYWSHRKALMIAFLLSLIVQAMIGLYYVITAQVTGLDISPLYFFAFLPAITLVSMAPISIGGLGVREVVMIFLFSRVGASSADVLTVSLIIHALNTVLSLSGGAILMSDSLRSRLGSRSS
jgi:uncharacterized membrane protein YbhN (UPF0104 family)